MLPDFNKFLATNGAVSSCDRPGRPTLLTKEEHNELQQLQQAAETNRQKQWLLYHKLLDRQQLQEKQSDSIFVEPLK